jgi:hypothetical protein
MKSDRLLALLLALQSAGKQSATALSEQLEVSVRTIFVSSDDGIAVEPAQLRASVHERARALAGLYAER